MKGGGGVLFRHSVDLLPKVAKRGGTKAVWGTERVGREGGFCIIIT